MLLCCHTYFSLRYGTLSPSQLLEAAAQNGYKALALTDINNTSATIDSLRLAEEIGIKLSIGIDFRNGIDQCYVGIAKNNEGYRELNQHLSEYTHKGQPFPQSAPNFEHVNIIYPLSKYKKCKLKNYEFIGISAKEVSILPFLYKYLDLSKCIIFQPLSFIQKRDFNAHRLLRAIDKNILLSRLEQYEQASLEEMTLPKSKLEEIFHDYPIIVENTKNLLAQSKFKIEMGKMSFKNKQFYTTSFDEDNQMLRRLCMEGLPYRYSEVNDEIIQRVKKELSVIQSMKFASYFLINWDIVNYARSKDYFYVGRGSGANSIVAYLLRITDVDPIELDLYFERFINPFRNNPPDFDIDFSWTDRDDITRYIFERFGYEHTALLGSYNTFQKDAVIRELGKVFGLPAHEIDKLQREKDLENLDSTNKLVIQYSQLIAGFPSHLSIHASGIIISEEPIYAYTATFMPPKGYPTTHFSMIEAEDIGLAKFDILSQRGLAKIKDTVDIVAMNHDLDIDIHDIKRFKEDSKVRELLRQGKCIGCFYIESPAMRMLLTKLQADDYLRLVAASSIIRPGVSKSGMMSEYIQRYRKPEKREKAKKDLPHLYKILEETYGVMVYQEDVIKVAHYFAGLSLADADYLRRGMSWKFKQRNEFHKVKENFFQNCLQKDYSQETIQDIWYQIESFANYAFSKAHSASYAVESFQALYLKAYYPLEYMVATLNNGGGYYRTEIYVHEARMHGGIIKAPCINRSHVMTTIDGNDIYLGFQMIQNIEANTVRAILHERSKGEFENLTDFIARVKISLEQIILLIRIGAFGFSGVNKKELLWQAHLEIHPKQEIHHQELFKKEVVEYKFPKLEHCWLDDALDEIELLGFPLCSPFKLLKNLPSETLVSKDLKTYLNKEIVIIGYLAAVKGSRTSQGHKMYFGTFLDQQGDWIDTVHFPPSAAAHPFRGNGCYSLRGKVVLEFDFIYIEVKEMKRLETINQENL